MPRRAALALAAAGLATGAAAGSAFADADAAADASHSPGVGSGNIGEIPVHIPVNVVGNTANLIGALNPAFGNSGANN
ncbi:chaplin [Streptomyces sp. PmtG]